MNCQQAQQWISGQRLFAQGLEEADASALAEHLSACPSCTAAMDREELFDSSTGRLMNLVEIPDQLEKNILWSMRRARRAKQRRTVLFASLAAATLLWVAISLGWYANRPYDLLKLQDTAWLLEKQRIKARFDPQSDGGLSALTGWLRSQGVDAPIPTQIKKQYVTAAYIVETDGRKIPILEMTVGNSACRVLLVQRRFFSDRQRQDLQEAGMASKVIADHDESSTLGWMIIDQGSAQNFLEESVPNSGA